MNSKILHAALFTLEPGRVLGTPDSPVGSKPGIGKTSFVKNAAHRYNLPFERLSPAERGEGAVRRRARTRCRTATCTTRRPQWAQKFDLAAAWSSSTRSPRRRRLSRRRSSGWCSSARSAPTPSGRAPASSAPPTSVQDAAGGWDLAPALANRFGHFDFEGLNATDWTSASSAASRTRTVQVDAETEERRVLAAWPLAIATARGLVAGFIKRAPRAAPQAADRAPPTPPAARGRRTAASSTRSTPSPPRASTT